MPFRKIKIPPPVQILDPQTGNLVAEVTFGAFLERVFNHPLWNEGIKAAKAQLSIRAAYDEANSAKAEDFTIADGDWAFVNRAVEKPQMTMIDGSTAAGLGYMPSIVSKVLPFMLAISEADELQTAPPAPVKAPPPPVADSAS